MGRVLSQYTAVVVVLAAFGCGGGSSTPIDAALSGDVGVDDAAVDAPADAPLDPATCLATSAATLVACAGAVQAGTKTAIEIRGSIECSGTDACAVVITGKAVTIRGVAGASIRRSDHHDYPLIKVSNAPSVTIRDLSIDEDADVECEPVSPTNPAVDNAKCGRTIDLYNAVAVVIDHVTIGHAKSTALWLWACGSVEITHSRFIAPLQFGISIGSSSGGFSIEDTLFWRAASNALVLGNVHGTAVAPLAVTRSFFDHNHRADVYYVCGAGGTNGNERCSGGQLYLSGPVDFLRVEHSVLKNGFTDGGGPPAGGVEINNSSIHDITFANNDVHAHGMWGIYANGNQTDLARVTLTNNKLYANGVYPGYLGVNVGNFPGGVVTETGTCTTPTCTQVRLGMLWALPLGPASWTTNDVAAPRITVDGVQVSTAPTGKAYAQPGATVVLFDGTTELDRLTMP